MDKADALYEEVCYLDTLLEARWPNGDFVHPNRLELNTKRAALEEQWCQLTGNINGIAFPWE